ncbi:nuclear apoptosis-inducing factor 1-like [Megalops cyprinoides]|uniref:nuclear apoptosis-inducing factor 1-like n=1 Tax=Megalops cyprinoides TaxID=118141 RepID=UPI001865451F|nr:nuclear apoptosis-inducing factor 1-like [Megalops cyprinoides]
MASLAKKRKMNFSEREVEIILEEIEKQKHILINHSTAGVTHIAKNNAWMEVLKKVNAVTTCPRELAEVKKKWSDLKTDVRRKVAQARAAVEGTSDCTPVPVILTPMQQRICNLLGEATIISLPAVDAGTEITLPIPMTTTVTLTQTETTYHALEDDGVVEYCTAEVPVETAVSVEAPVEMPSVQTEGGDRPHELKGRIALNSARLLQEQRLTNLHVREIAQRLENQSQLLQMIRRSQETQAGAQERQAQALEGSQAALSALIQMLRPTLKELRKYLQSGTSGSVHTPLIGQSEQRLKSTQPEEDVQ